MKTLINTTALLVSLTVLFTVNLNASTYSFNDEAYIDDIPFNTTEVFNDIIAEHNLAEFNFEDEEYIDDICFNTRCVTVNCLYTKAISVDFHLEEEQYVDDIPFDTECISMDCHYNKAMLVEFDFEEEGTIDDMGL